MQLLSLPHFLHFLDCNFKIGDMTLRVVDSSDLQDQVKVVEDKISVAQLLQTLDCDGNASNGVTLLPDVISAIKGALINTVPDSAEKLSQIYNVAAQVGTYQGKLISQEDAQAHMVQILDIGSKLAGKTIYEAWSKEYGQGITKITFANDMKSMTSEEIAGSDVGSKSTITIVSIDGPIINIVEDGVGKVLVYQHSTSEYIVVLKPDGEVSKFYKHQSDAVTYLDSLPAKAQISGTVTVNGNTYNLEAADMGMDFSTPPVVHFNIVQFKVNSKNTLGSGQWLQFHTSYTSKVAFDAALPVGVATQVSGTYNIFHEIYDGSQGVSGTASITRNGDGTYNFNATVGNNSASIQNISFVVYEQFPGR
ncbi:MAG: hypothetical protein NTW78_02915 [Campylobacterales bacterium]|nr:hypothetical protein [Campylobacterales bacterium]